MLSISLELFSVHALQFLLLFLQFFLDHLDRLVVLQQLEDDEDGTSVEASVQVRLDSGSNVVTEVKLAGRVLLLELDLELAEVLEHAVQVVVADKDLRLVLLAVVRLLGDLPEHLVEAVRVFDVTKLDTHSHHLGKKRELVLTCERYHPLYPCDRSPEIWPSRTKRHAEKIEVLGEVEAAPMEGIDVEKNARHANHFLADTVLEEDDAVV